MYKKIAVQEGLNEVAEELTRKGFNIVDSDSKDIDAYIYMADGYDISSLNSIMNMNGGELMDSNKGTLLINMKGKNIYDVENILNKGYYTPLF